MKYLTTFHLEKIISFHCDCVAQNVVIFYSQLSSYLYLYFDTLSPPSQIQTHLDVVKHA